MKRPSAWAPIAMSLAALALVLGYVWYAVTFGPGLVRHEDEGTPAHLFQLLMGGQLPIILYFALRWLPEAPRQALAVLALQFLAGVLAFAPVYILEL